jgi:hypothetical protein
MIRGIKTQILNYHRDREDSGWEESVLTVYSFLEQDNVTSQTRYFWNYASDDWQEAGTVILK